VIKRDIAVAAAVLIATSSWPSEAQSAFPDTEGISPVVRSAYESFRDAMYNDEPLEVLEKFYEQAIRALEGADLQAGTRELWRGRFEFVLARGYDSHSERMGARAHYERSLAFAEAALEQGASSDAWRLRSESLGHLCLMKGLGFLLSNGRKAIGFAKKALQLDPKNAGARIIVAASKIYPPPVFGGDPAEGIQLMKQVFVAGTAERDELFNICSGIGLAYEKLKNRQAAREWLLRALQLYPGNLFVRGEYSRACR
jgi:tetratricopeptide (TPR) repeat protein